MEKIELVREFMGQGYRRNESLKAAGITKNQFYYKSKGTKPGKPKTEVTRWRDPKTRLIKNVPNADIVKQIVDIKVDPDHANWYRLITNTMQIRGYYINHKKVYRLMFEGLLLEDPVRKTGRNFVKFRKIAPTGPFQIIEMDIKYVWVEGSNKYAFVFTILDTFTRYALHWSVGYSMKSEQIKWAWEYVIAEYLQPHCINPKDLVIEVRSDNGKQFTSDMIRRFFEDNGLDQVYTKPYTPEENGHIESFHSILNKALANDTFTNLKNLEQRLERFYTCYNNDRSHSGTKGIPPAKFWALYTLNHLEIIPLKVNAIRIKLKVAYQDILTIPEIDMYQYRVKKPEERSSLYF